LEKYEILEAEHALTDGSVEGSAVTVDNLLIRSSQYTRSFDKCENFSKLRMLIFYDDDLSIKNRLVVGDSCGMNEYGRYNIHYLNPDSIYYAYPVSDGNAIFTGNTIRISNFSSEGKLNFDETLDLSSEPVAHRFVTNCKALSNGGALICGKVNFGNSGFLILYHPPKNTGIAQIPNSQLQVFPNPATGQLRVVSGDISDGNDKAIQIYNVVGQVVYTSTVSPLSPETIIDINHLANGLYFLKVDNKVVKIVKN